MGRNGPVPQGAGLFRAAWRKTVVVRIVSIPGIVQSASHPSGPAFTPGRARPSANIFNVGKVPHQGPTRIRNTEFCFTSAGLPGNGHTTAQPFVKLVSIFSHVSGFEPTLIKRAGRPDRPPPDREQQMPVPTQIAEGRNMRRMSRRLSLRGKQKQAVTGSYGFLTMAAARFGLGLGMGEGTEGRVG